MLAVGRDVDHGLAHAEARDEDEQGQPEQWHEREHGVAGGEVGARHEEPQGGAGADRRPGAAGGEGVEEPGEHDRGGDERERAEPGDEPDERGAPGTVADGVRTASHPDGPRDPRQGRRNPGGRRGGGR